MNREAFSRAPIDKDLEFSDGNLLNPKEACFEFSGHTGLAAFR